MGGEFRPFRLDGLRRKPRDLLLDARRNIRVAPQRVHEFRDKRGPRRQKIAQTARPEDFLGDLRVGLAAAGKLAGEPVRVRQQRRSDRSRGLLVRVFCSESAPHDPLDILGVADPVCDAGFGGLMVLLHQRNGTARGRNRENLRRIEIVDGQPSHIRRGGAASAVLRSDHRDHDHLLGADPEDLLARVAVLQTGLDQKSARRLRTGEARKVFERQQLPRGLGDPALAARRPVKHRPRDHPVVLLQGRARAAQFDLSIGRELVLGRMRKIAHRAVDRLRARFHEHRVAHPRALTDHEAIAGAHAPLHSVELNGVRPETKRPSVNTSRSAKPLRLAEATTSQEARTATPASTAPRSRVATAVA